MRRHCRLEHQISLFASKGRPSSLVRRQTPQTAALWRSVRCQRVYPSGESSGYFEIRESAPSLDTVVSATKSSTVDVQIDALRTQAYTRDRDNIETGELTETSPWLNRTGWAIYLVGCQRSQLLQLIEPPRTNNPPWERIIWIAMLETAQLCEQSVRTSAGHFLRTEIMQTEYSRRSQQVLQPYQREDIARFVRPWQEIAIFFLRTMSSDNTRLPPYRLRVSQLKALQELRNTAETLAESDRPTTSREELSFSCLHSCCLRFCVCLLDHSVRTKEYESPLIGALAVLGVTEHGFKTPQQYTSLLSSLIKLSRYFVVRAALYGFASSPADAGRSSTSSRASDSSDDSIVSESPYDDVENEKSSALSRLESMSRRLMRRGTHGPIEWMLDLRSYGMKMVFNTTQAGYMEWNGDLVLYREIQFTMAEFRAWVHGLLREAQSLCTNELLWHRTTGVAAPSLDWDSLRDDRSNASVGWNFLQDQRSSWPVQGDSWLFQRSQQTDALRTIFWPERQRKSKPPKGVQTYLRTVAIFRAQLLLLMHITGGQPARITELLSVRHRNTAAGQQRNIYIENGMVVFVTRYHKGYSRSGEIKLIHRYVPFSVGWLIVQYLWLILPFVERLEIWYYNMERISAFMWPHESWGRKWGPERVREVMERESLLALGQKINLQSYRQLAIGISRRHLRTSHQFEDEEDELVADEDSLESVMAQQAAHSLMVAETTYGRALHEPSGERASVRQRYREVSLMWHRFLYLQSMPGEAGPRSKRAGSLGLHDSDQMRKRWRALYEADPIQQLRSLYGDSAHLRPLQADSLRRILRGESPLLVVMPTGAGKSLLFVLPASYEASEITVVIVPLISLRQDLARRCQTHGINCREYPISPSDLDDLKILLVTPEVFVRPEFRDLLNRLRTANRLDRIVLDECHLLLDRDPSFRTAFLQLWELALVETQLLFLTATMPPSRESDFWRALRLRYVSPTPLTLRTTTTRANIRYEVRSLPTKEDIVPEVRQLIAGAWLWDKILIFCTTIDMVESLAQELGSLRYYAKLPNKDEMLQQFDRPECRTMVATTALSLGLNKQDIGLIVHIDHPFSLLNYAQESGRGGRDGRECHAVIVRASAEDSLAMDWPLRQYLWGTGSQPSCRRVALDHYLDGRVDRTQCEENKDEKLCDICEAKTSASVLELSSSTSDINAIILDSYETQQHQRSQTRVRVLDKSKQEALTYEKQLQALETLQSRCLLCSHLEDILHSIDKCQSENRAAYDKIKIWIQRTIRFARFSGCFECGLPQAVCDRWTRQGQRDFVRVRDTICQYAGLLIEGAALFFYLDPTLENQQRTLYERCEIAYEPANSKARQALVRYLGRKNVWHGLESNNLLIELLFFLKLNSILYNS
ncbi:MAG: hypothetical protein Q9218_007122 [Villophora microphyllina]